MIADFLFFERGRSVSAIKVYRSSLTLVIQSQGIDLSNDSSFKALIQGFTAERPVTRRSVPDWDLMLVL